MSSPNELRALLRGSVPPSKENRERLLAFLRRTYGSELDLDWEQDDSLTGGFVLQVGTDVYDWSVEGRASPVQRPVEPDHAFRSERNTAYT